MDAISQLLLRNARLLEGAKQALWFNPPADCSWRQIGEAPGRLRLFSQDYATWRWLASAGADAEYGVVPGSGPRPDTIILSLPREKALLRMLAHMAATRLRPSGNLLLAGENRAGIKSCGPSLQRWFRSVEHVDSARHGAVYRAREPVTEVPFDIDGYRGRWELASRDGSLWVHSWPGVFAHGGLDPGSRLLLEHLPRVRAGTRVLDFGCGSGVLGASVLLRQPEADCVLADRNALACLSASATLDANGMAAQVVSSDGFSDITGRYGLIISNPPFHDGHRSVVTLSPGLLAPILNFLRPGGQLILVANRHLPYRRWLDEVFGAHEILARDSRYHVMRARRPD